MTYVTAFFSIIISVDFFIPTRVPSSINIREACGVDDASVIHGVAKSIDMAQLLVHNAKILHYVEDTNNGEDDDDAASDMTDGVADFSIC